MGERERKRGTEKERGRKRLPECPESCTAGKEVRGREQEGWRACEKLSVAHGGEFEGDGHV